MAGRVLPLQIRRMIVRTWRARTTTDRAYLYPMHFTEEVLPRLRALDGFEGAYLLRRDETHDHVEFLVQTLWESMEAVRRFAGATPDVAVVDVDAEAMLTSFDAHVAHYEILVAPTGT